MRRLKIGHANVYQANRTPARAARALRRLRCHSLGGNELLRIAGRLRRLEGYRLHVADHGAMRRGYRDTGVLVREQLESYGALHVKLSEAVPWKIKLAPDRWAAVALYRHGRRRIAHVSVHLNAGAVKSAEYGRSVERLAELLEYLEGAGYRVVVSGDVNDRPGGPVYVMLEARGYVVRRRGVDLLAAGPGLKLGRLHVIDGRRYGADHPWLWAWVTITRRGRRRRRG